MPRENQTHDSCNGQLPRRAFQLRLRCKVNILFYIPIFNSSQSHADRVAIFIPRPKINIRTIFLYTTSNLLPREMEKLFSTKYWSRNYKWNKCVGVYSWSTIAATEHFPFNFSGLFSNIGFQSAVRDRFVPFRFNNPRIPMPYLLQHCHGNIGFRRVIAKCANYLLLHLTN